MEPLPAPFNPLLLATVGGSKVQAGLKTPLRSDGACRPCKKTNCLRNSAPCFELRGGVRSICGVGVAFDRFKILKRAIRGRFPTAAPGIFHRPFVLRTLGRWQDSKTSPLDPHGSGFPSDRKGPSHKANYALLPTEVVRPNLPSQNRTDSGKYPVNILFGVSGNIVIRRKSRRKEENS